MRDFLEIQFWRVAKWLIRHGYGANCETKDYEDNMFADPDEMRQYLQGTSRCGSCRAKEVIEWIDHHVNLLRY